MPDGGDSASHDPADLKRASRALSFLLRHGAIEAGLAMDAAGWAPLADARAWMRGDGALLEAVVAHNNKARFERDGDRIRASQGHSLDGTPVTREALEASWVRWVGEASLWHGTSVGAVEGIAREGILPVARSHVHLAEHTDATVGKRAGVHVLLEVSPGAIRGAERGVWRSPNGVVLTREVPPACIVGLIAVTKRARREEERLRGLLGRM